MSLLSILLVWLVGYTLAALIAKRRGRIPERFSVHGPLLLVHSNLGLDAIDRLARRFPRFWRLWGGMGVAAAGVGLLAGAALIIQAAVAVLLQPQATSLASDPKNLLVIPGVNDYLPLSAAPALVLALLIGMVAHEAGHAIYCRLGNIDIKSTGMVFLACIPAGAFVEPDEHSQQDASRWARLQMVSAGVMNNLALTVVGFGLLILIASVVISPAPGGAVGGVLADSPAADTGLTAGDRITHIDGEAVTSNDDARAALAAADAEVTLQTHDGTVHHVTREVFLAGVPQSEQLSLGRTITHVNGEPVTTTAEFHTVINAVDDQTVSLRMGDGAVITYPVGARVTVGAESPLSTLDPDAERLFITHVSGERVRSAADLQAALEPHTAGDHLAVQVVSPETHEPVAGSITLGAADAPGGKLGAAPTEGVSGLSVADLGVQFYPVEQYLSFLNTPTPYAFFVLLFLPFGTLLGLPFNFAGFTADIASFYTVAPPLAPVEGGVLFAASVLFWTVWLNINLAVFNCIPTVALDGGHYLSLAVEELAERLGLPDAKQTGDRVTRGIVLLFLLCLLLVATLPAIAGVVLS